MRSGAYPFTILKRANPQTGEPIDVMTGRPIILGPGQVYSPGGMLLEETPVEVVWMPNGIGHLRAHMRMDYLGTWQSWYKDGFIDLPGSTEGRHHSNDKILNEDGGYDPGSGRAGGVGRFLVRGDRRLGGRSNGRANVGIKKDVTAAFAHNLFANGIARMLKWDLGGGEPPLDRYGNMLRYFFIPIPTWGQIWPRKERQHGQPVG
jgi:hypothetical protein